MNPYEVLAQSMDLYRATFLSCVTMQQFGEVSICFETEFGATLFENMYQNVRPFEPIFTGIEAQRQDNWITLRWIDSRSAAHVYSELFRLR